VAVGSVDGCSVEAVARGENLFRIFCVLVKVEGQYEFLNF
jgi:hypothetical protein